jgi:hypothetical protein
MAIVETQRKINVLVFGIIVNSAMLIALLTELFS